MTGDYRTEYGSDLDRSLHTWVGIEEMVMKDLHIYQLNLSK
jgi:hypothetical protein